MQRIQKSLFDTKIYMQLQASLYSDEAFIDTISSAADFSFYVLAAEYRFAVTIKDSLN